MTATQGLLESMVMKPENILVQVTMMKLTKDNYLHWVVAATMRIASKGRIKYIKGKKRQLNEDNPT